MTKRLCVLCLPVLAALAALPVPAQTPPNFTGTWKLQQDPATASSNAPRDVVFFIEHKEPRFKYTATGTSGFMPFREAYEFTTDGRAPADPSTVSVSANWDGQTLVMKYLKRGELIATVRLRCSPDGKQMIREADIDANHQVREVYDRQ